MLYSLEVPPGGGNTYFADMFAAYDTLPAHLEKAVEGKVAVHDASRNSAGMLRKGYKEVTDVRETVGARHPLVRTDRQTGRDASLAESGHDGGFGSTGQARLGQPFRQFDEEGFVHMGII